MCGFVENVLAEKGRQVYTVKRSASVCDAVREMNEQGVGALLVVDDELPVGIFTERDVLRRIVASDRDPALVRVGEVMTRSVATISPTAHVEEAMELMTRERFRHLPVVDGGSVIGIVS